MGAIAVFQSITESGDPAGLCDRNSPIEGKVSLVVVLANMGKIDKNGSHTL